MIFINFHSYYLIYDYFGGVRVAQPQVIKFTSCLPMVGGGQDIAEILLKVALKHQKSIIKINRLFRRYCLIYV